MLKSSRPSNPVTLTYFGQSQPWVWLMGCHLNYRNPPSKLGLPLMITERDKGSFCKQLEFSEANFYQLWAEWWRWKFMRPKGLSELCLLSFPPLGIAFTVFYKFVCLEERRSTSVAVGNMKIFALYIWREASIPLEVDGAEYYSKATKIKLLATSNKTHKFN